MLQTRNVQSSAIAALRYLSNNTLRVWFSGRTVYDYLDVPEHIAASVFNQRELSDAGTGSVGRAYNVLVKGQYRSVKRIGYRVRKEF